ncbi:hypothetical protein M426DRAFT_320397, partial [Hypoxylon sp. CI-4A]
MMGSMPPGAAGPNAHALQHLTPQQQMFQQQQQFALANPQFVALQHQRLLQQQHQRQAQAAMMQQQQQMYGAGMPMNMSGMNMAQYQQAI